MRSSVVMTCAVCAREASGEAAFCSRCGSRLLLDAATAEAGPSLGSVPAQRSRRDGRERAQARPSFSRTPVPTTSARPAQAPVAGGTVRLASLLAELDDDIDLRDGAIAGDQRREDLRREDPWQEEQRRAEQQSQQHDDRWSPAEDAPRPTVDSDSWRGGDGEGSPSRRVPVVLAVIALVLGLLVVGLLVHSLMAAPKIVVPTGASPGSPGTSQATDGAGSSAPAASASPSASAAAGAAVVGATAQAPATSPDSRDSAGDPTSYAASQMLDGDPSTTWRMDGDGAGATLTFSFASPRSITSLGLVNGYAKVDPDSGTDRYTQERRITHVTWVVDGHSYPQALADGDRSVQSTPVPGVAASTVQLHIDTTTAPGQPAFDKTAISDIAIGS